MGKSDVKKSECILQVDLRLWAGYVSVPLFRGIGDRVVMSAGGSRTAPMSEHGGDYCSPGK